MGYHDASEIPNYWAYAKHYVLQDHMFESANSWSLPAHLALVSGWSAKCSRPSDPMSCVTSLTAPFGAHGRRQEDGLPVDGSHIPPVPPPRELALLRRHRDATRLRRQRNVLPACRAADFRDAQHLEPAAGASTRCIRTARSATSQPVDELLHRGEDRPAAERRLDRPVAGGERAPARRRHCGSGDMSPA